MASCGLRRDADGCLSSRAESEAKAQPATGLADQPSISPVQKRINVLDDLASELRRRVHELEERLERVLTPPFPTETDPLKVMFTSYSCPLDETLDNLADHLSVTSLKLQDLTRRIAL